jgi:hypothetical protein
MLDEDQKEYLRRNAKAFLAARMKKRIDVTSKKVGMQTIQKLMGHRKIGTTALWRYIVMYLTRL